MKRKKNLALLSNWKIDNLITQRSFFRDGVSFVSFTYCGIWNGTIDDLTLKKGEIAEAKWFALEDAIDNAVSEFDRIALNHFKIEQNLWPLGVHHPILLHANRLLRHRWPTTTPTTDMGYNRAKKFDSIVSFRGDALFRACNHEFSTTLSEPRTASVGVLESRANSCNIEVNCFRLPSTSMMTTRTPSMDTESSPPPDVLKRTISAFKLLNSLALLFPFRKEAFSCFG